MSTQVSPNAGLLGFKQIRTAGCLGYILWEKATAEAVLIDPAADAQEEFREIIQSRGLKLASIIETHSHTDRPSCAQALQRESGAKVVMGRRTSSAGAGRLVSNQEKIRFGSLELEVLETPGHTPDSICLVYTDPHTKVHLAFTGDTLMIGSTGRTDFSSADSGSLFDSLRAMEKSLPLDTFIFPAHDNSDTLFSSLQLEQKLNSQFSEKDRQKFMDQKYEESLTAGGSSQKNTQRVPSITVQKYAVKLGARASGELYIDVREEEEFQSGHMPGAENIPISALALDCSRLMEAKKVYLSCYSGRRSEMAARTLDRLGIQGVVNVTGGFQAWSKAGLAVEKPRG